MPAIPLTDPTEIRTRGTKDTICTLTAALLNSPKLETTPTPTTRPLESLPLCSPLPPLRINPPELATWDALRHARLRDGRSHKATEEHMSRSQSTKPSKQHQDSALCPAEESSGGLPEC